MSVSAEELLTLQRGGSADRERLILKRAHAIEDAMSELHELDERARRTCEKIKKELGYDFVTVQLVDLGEQTIQTVQGSGLVGAWYNIARHSLEGDPKFLDIQAHVALATPPVIEIIAGWDPRFDRFIYQKFRHEDFVRAFVPLIVTRHRQNGALTKADPRQFRFELTDDDRLGVIQVIPHLDRDFRAYEVIGTIEAGYDNSRRSTKKARRLSPRDARELFEWACRHAYNLYRATLRHVLEVITHSALEIARADYANLHFPLDSRHERNTYDIWAGAPLSRTLKPRPGGLAERAIKAAQPGFLSGVSLKEFNPKAYAAGVHAIGVYPLIMSEGSTSDFTRSSTTEAKTGALYVAFKEEHVFTEDEKDGLQLFTNLAEDAIRQAMHSMDVIHTARQLANLHEISRSLADEADHENFLESIAGHSLNVLAADLVMIYEYDHAQGLFLSKPATAGQRDARSGEPGVSDGVYSPPLHLMSLKGTEYARSAQKLMTFYASPGAETACRCFVEREQLVAGAAVPLYFGDEAVGIIFVNYRRSHAFSKYEQSIIETLASTAAVAIQYRRLLRGRQQAILVMTHQLRNTFNAMREKILHAAEQLGTRGALKARKQREAKEQLVRIADQLGSFDDWNDALFVSLQDAGEAAAPEPENIDIPVEIKGVWELVKSARAGCDLTLRVTGPASDSRTAHINRGVFRNVLYSLFDNARKYADSGSELRVEWTAQPAMVKVRSIGTPISPDEREKIFNKFGQGREVARKRVPRSGIGLGLWVSRRLLKLAGGSIWLEPDFQNPRATTFVVRLPDIPVTKVTNGKMQ